MARLQLSKATLSRERQQLASYQRFLPSLDMKRQQLRLALKTCEGERQDCLDHIDSTITAVGEAIPMLANEQVALDGLVQIQHVKLTQRRLGGVAVPALEKVELSLAQWPLLSKPHWVWAVQQTLADLQQLQVRADILQQQALLVKRELDKITQRVNLFEKVLIPRAQANIKRIQIFLDDRAREAVITSKIAKKRHAERQDL